MTASETFLRDFPSLLVRKRSLIPFLQVLALHRDIVVRDHKGCGLVPIFGLASTVRNSSRSQQLQGVVGVLQSLDVLLDGGQDRADVQMRSGNGHNVLIQSNLNLQCLPQVAQRRVVLAGSLVVAPQVVASNGEEPIVLSLFLVRNEQGFSVLQLLECRPEIPAAKVIHPVLVAHEDEILELARALRRLGGFDITCIFEICALGQGA
jgi:hypothetical protein